MAKELDGLERECANWQDQKSHEDGSRYSYGAQAYGGCLEPGYRLTTERHTTECPECRRWQLFRRDWEAAEGGSLNAYYSEECGACGYYETNADEDW